jgi:hypothetical protein
MKMTNSAKRLRALAALAVVGTCVAFVAGSATASRSATPAVAMRLTATLTAAQEVPAVQSPARGHWTAVLIRSGVGTARVASLAGCRIMTAPPRSGRAIKVNCGGIVTVLPAAPGQWRLIWHLATSHLSGPVTGVDIHLGAVGQAAPVMLSLCGSFPCVASGHVLLGDSQATSIANGSAYVNVDTAAHPSGEIRGQIVKATFGTFGR